MKVDDLIQTHQTNDTRVLYKALGKGHLHDYQMREAKIAAANWRRKAAIKGRKPGGMFGMPILTLPEIVVDHYREGRKELYQTDKNKFWCWLWHRFPDFRCSPGKCQSCGRM